MKKSPAILPVVLILTALTGCLGDYAESAEMEASSKAASRESRAALKVVPDVAGKTFDAAKAALNNDGLVAVAVGKDGKQWSEASPGSAVKVVSTYPASGAKTFTNRVRVFLDASESGQ